MDEVSNLDWFNHQRSKWTTLISVRSLIFYRALVCDGAVVLLEAHPVHGFTYFDQTVKLWVYDGVVGLMEAHKLRGSTHHLVTTIAANQERLFTLGPELRFAQTLLRESLHVCVPLEIQEMDCNKFL